MEDDRYGGLNLLFSTRVIFRMNIQAKRQFQGASVDTLISHCNFQAETSTTTNLPLAQKSNMIIFACSTFRLYCQDILFQFIFKIWKKMTKFSHSKRSKSSYVNNINAIFSIICKFMLTVTSQPEINTNIATKWMDLIKRRNSNFIMIKYLFARRHFITMKPLLNLRYLSQSVCFLKETLFLFKITLAEQDQSAIDQIPKRD